MSIVPVLFYFLGAATTVLAAALLVQPDRSSFHAGQWPAVAAAGLLLMPAALLLVFSGAGQHAAGEDAWRFLPWHRSRLAPVA